MITTKYQNDYFYDWLENATNPYLVSTIKETFNLWLEHYNGNPININNYLNQYNAVIDEDDGNLIFVVERDIRRKTIELINQYGVSVQLDNPDNRLITLNVIFSTLLSLDTHEDILRVDEILQSGNSNLERFAMFIQLIHPEVKEDEILSIIDEVNDGFFTRLYNVIKDKVALVNKQLNDAHSIQVGLVNRTIQRYYRGYHQLPMFSDKTQHWVNSVAFLLTDFAVDMTMRDIDLNTPEEYTKALIDCFRNIMAPSTVREYAFIVSTSLFLCKPVFGHIEKIGEFLNGLSPLDILTTPEKITEFHQHIDNFNKLLEKGALIDEQS